MSQREKPRGLEVLQPGRTPFNEVAFALGAHQRIVTGKSTIPEEKPRSKTKREAIEAIKANPPVLLGAIPYQSAPQRWTRWRGVELEQIVRGEYDENVERLPFQGSEVYAIWQAMRPAEAAAARERQVSGLRHGSDGPVCEISAHGEDEPKRPDRVSNRIAPLPACPAARSRRSCRSRKKLPPIQTGSGGSSSGTGGA